MSNEEDNKETAGRGVDDADKSSENQEKVSPAVNGKGILSIEISGEDRKQVSASILEGEEPDTGAEHPNQSAEAANDASNTSDAEFKIPEILPLAGAREDSGEQADEEETKDEDERVWGNQVGGHVDREEVPVRPAGSSFDVSQISIKKSESVKKTHSGSRRAITWVLGVTAVIALVGVALYASGIWQKIFTSEGAASPKEGARAYYVAFLDKDAETLCALRSPTARGDVIQKINQSQGENSQPQAENSLEQCTKVMKTAFSQVKDTPTMKLSELVFAPEKTGDVGQVKAVLIKDKQDNPLGILGWQQIDGRWFLAGDDLQQKVYMKYKQSLAAKAQVSK